MSSELSEDEGFVDAPEVPPQTPRKGKARTTSNDEGYVSNEKTLRFIPFGDDEDGEGYWVPEPESPTRDRGKRKVREAGSPVMLGSESRAAVSARYRASVQTTLNSWRQVRAETEQQQTKRRRRDLPLDGPLIDEELSQTEVEEDGTITVLPLRLRESSGCNPAALGYEPTPGPAPQETPPVELADTAAPAPAPAPEPYNIKLGPPTYPLEVGPPCRFCKGPSFRVGVEPSNKFSPAGRPYWACEKDTCGSGRAFVAWDDEIGIEPTNHKCSCGFPSRLDIKSWRTDSEGEGFFSCSIQRCRYLSHDRDGLTFWELERKGMVVRRFRPEGFV